MKHTSNQRLWVFDIFIQWDF